MELTRIAVINKHYSNGGRYSKIWIFKADFRDSALKNNNSNKKLNISCCLPQNIRHSKILYKISSSIKPNVLKNCFLRNIDELLSWFLSIHLSLLAKLTSQLQEC